MIGARRFYPFEDCAVWVYRDRIRTIMWDGAYTDGVPPQDDAFRQSARDLGYGEDIYWHMMEHDLLHSYIAHSVWGRHSTSLWNQAHNPRAYLEAMPAEAAREEKLLGGLQAALNGLAWGKALLREELKVLPHNMIDATITAARALARPHGEMMTKEWASK